MIVFRKICRVEFDSTAIRAVIKIEPSKLHDFCVATVQSNFALVDCLIIDLKI